MLDKSKSKINIKQWQIQDFPDWHKPQRWGRQPIILANFPQKLHETYQWKTK